jgi:hypothetical protein
VRTQLRGQHAGVQGHRVVIVVVVAVVPRLFVTVVGAAFERWGSRAWGLWNINGLLMGYGLWVSGYGLCS